MHVHVEPFLLHRYVISAISDHLETIKDEKVRISFRVLPSK